MTLSIAELVIGTHNPGKIGEFADLLSDTPVILRGLSEFPYIEEVEETGKTFGDNAGLKASRYALQTSRFALADDSGLEVDALDGRPGVLSARYGGEGLGFDQKMELVLEEVRSSSTGSRTARFVCSIAVADPAGSIIAQAEGVCGGHLAEFPRGSGGFGYDPIFIPDGFEKTFGELSAPVKHEISHRAHALAEIIPFLRDNIAIRLDRTDFQP